MNFFFLCCFSHFPTRTFLLPWTTPHPTLFFFFSLILPNEASHTHTPPLFSLFSDRPPHLHPHASSLPLFSFCYFLQCATTIASPHSRHHHCVMHHHRDPSSTQSPSPLEPSLRPLPRATKVTTPWSSEFVLKFFSIPRLLVHRSLNFGSMLFFFVLCCCWFCALIVLLSVVFPLLFFT